jgi:hypothetical protein
VAAATKVVGHRAWRDRCAVVDAASEFVVEVNDSGFIITASARAQQLHKALDVVTRNRSRSGERLSVPNRLWSTVSLVVASSRAALVELASRGVLLPDEAVVERLDSALALVDFDGPGPCPIDEATSIADGAVSGVANENEPGRPAHNDPREARAC